MADNKAPGTAAGAVPGPASGPGAALLEAIDGHVGARLRARRRDLGWSQSELAERCGVAYQQVAKYERGENSVSASRLFVLAGALGADPGYFFEGLEELVGASSGTIEDAAEMARRMRAAREGQQLAEAFRRISDTRTRDLLMTLSRELASKR